MKLQEYLSTLDNNESVTFIIQFKASVSDHIDQTLYRETPINTVREWMRYGSLLNYEVIKEDQQVLSRVWDNMYKNKSVKCILITNEYDYIYNPKYKKPKNQIIYGE